MLCFGRVLPFQRLDIWSGYAFQQPEMEQLYQEHHRKSTLPFAKWWGINHAVIYTFVLVVSGFKYGWLKSISLSIVPYLVPLLLVLALLCMIKFTTRFSKVTEQMLCATCIILIGFLCWQVRVAADDELKDTYNSTLPDVWAAVDNLPFAKDQLTAYIQREETRKWIWVALLQSSLLFGFLHFIGLSRYTLAAYLSLPCGMMCVTCISPLPTRDLGIALSGTGIVILYSICMSLYMLRSHRRQFQSDYNLQQSLAKEAQTMQELMRQEKALKETSQEADTILNHILKNMMADAHACIHLFLDSFEGALPSDLAQASSCLERGMTWCRKRQAILHITAGNYIPSSTCTNLKEMGTAIVRGRNVTTSFVDQDVFLDPLLCEIVWDNALNNAFRHGHPVNPDVHFSMNLIPLSHSSLPSNCFRLLVIISNLADPSCPTLTQERVAHMASNQHTSGSSLPSTSLSEHLGLPHMFMAAQAHGMLLSLEQFGNRVVLEAQLEVSVTSLMAESVSHCDVPSPKTLPTGLTILCLDDSLIARRLLRHTLAGNTIQARIQMFGEDSYDVTKFVQQAFTADIIILDNHLEFDDIHILGVDLLAQLRERGFKGFACIRSADAWDEDEVAYYRRGAHLVLGKDLVPSEMIARLSAAYHQWRQLGCSTCNLGSSVQSLCGTTRYPTLLQEHAFYYESERAELMPGIVTNETSFTASPFNDPACAL